MRNKRQLAIHNNNALYDAIFANHDLEFHRTNSVCYTLKRTPPLYSNLVTLSGDWMPDKIFENIDLNFERGNWPEWSIKDSFGVLDLYKYNFSKLFDARWVYLKADRFIPLTRQKGISYKIIYNENDLAAWRLAWDSDEKLGNEIFSSKLLNDPNVLFIAGFEGRQIVCGCFINKSADVMGISNFFGNDNNINFRAEIIDFVFSSVGRFDIVGYAQNNPAEHLKSLNFETVGNLIVWLKKRAL